MDGKLIAHLIEGSIADVDVLITHRHLLKGIAADCQMRYPIH